MPDLLVVPLLLGAILVLILLKNELKPVPKEDVPDTAIFNKESVILIIRALLVKLLLGTCLSIQIRLTARCFCCRYRC